MWLISLKDQDILRFEVEMVTLKLLTQTTIQKQIIVQESQCASQPYALTEDHRLLCWLDGNILIVKIVPQVVFRQVKEETIGITPFQSGFGDKDILVVLVGLDEIFQNGSFGLERLFPLRLEVGELFLRVVIAL